MLLIKQAHRFIKIVPVWKRQINKTKNQRKNCAAKRLFVSV